MTRVLLDTSAYSVFLRGHADVKLVLQVAEEICLSPVVLGELRSGFLRGTRRRENESTLLTFLASPRVRVVTVTEDTAECYAAIHHYLRSAGTPIPTNDIWIAASAMQHGLRLLTMDTHYRRIHQVLVTCFDASAPP